MDFDVNGLVSIGMSASQPVKPVETKDNDFAPTIIALHEKYNHLDLTKAIREAAFHPLRRRGTVTLQTVASFIKFVNRMKEPNTVIFADRTKNIVTAVLNYHDQVTMLPPVSDGGFPLPSDGMAQWGDFKAVFAFPKSRQWETWTGVHRKKLTQSELALFIEDNIRDIRHEGHSELPDNLLEIVNSLNLKVGTPSRLLATARGFALHSEEIVRNVINTSTGETQLVYEQNHTPGGGVQTLDVPTAFTVGLPVFYGDPAYHLLCRLRHAKSGTSVNWSIDIQGLDAALEDAFNIAIDEIMGATETCTVFGESPAPCSA
jgi:hypothetical protein